MGAKKGNPFVGIAASLGGMSVGIVAILAVLARDQLMIAVWIVCAFTILGIGLGAMAWKYEKLTSSRGTKEAKED